MVVFGALRDALDTALGDRAVVLAALATAALTSVFPLIGALLDPQSFRDPAASIGQLSAVIAPFAVGGMIGVAGRSLRSGDARSGDYLDDGRGHYVGLLVAIYAFQFGLWGVVLAIVLALAIAIPVLAALLAFAGGDVLSLAVAGLGALITLLVVLAYVAAFQFYDVAIVLEGADLADAFRASKDVLGEAPGAVAGYTALKLTASLVVGGLPFVYVGYRVVETDLLSRLDRATAVEGAPGTVPSSPLTEAVMEIATDPVLVLIGFGGTFVASVLLTPLHVAFYDRVTASGDE